MSILETPAVCTILVNNEQVSYDISSVRLNQYIDSHHILTVRIREVGKVSADQDFDDPKLYTDFLGKTISVNIKPSGGVVEESRELEFIGVVTKVSLENSIDGINIVNVTAHSPTVALDGGKVNAFYLDQSAGDIINAIVDKYQITKGDTESTSGEYKFNVQHHETDYEYVMRLATAKGLFAFYDGKEFCAVKASGADTEELVWRKTLGAFTVGLGTASQEFNAASYNYEQKKIYTQDTKSIPQEAALSEISAVAPEASKQVYTGSGFSSAVKTIDDAQSLDEILKNERSRAVSRMISCCGQSIVPKVAVGHGVKITGMAKFDGTYWVTEVKHVFDESGKYHNSFICSPLDTAAPQYESKTQPKTFLQSAVVVDNNDPDKLGRIKVKFPWLGDETIWIRVLSPHAGNGHGWICTPEIDDEVLVGFEHGNPNYPIAIGSLYNKDNKPSDESGDSENNVKIFCTKGGNQIYLGDADGSQSIKITQGKNQLILSMDGPKITIESTDGDISIKAKNIKLESDQKIEVKSGTDTVIEAGGNLQLKGSIEGKLEAGMVTVKGNPISLN
ncbi:MAG: type VI secretion system tip protein VgrG [Candidatus Zixiibacteriota bacterium]|nr:MAG: type VI secretion system tip protein VgrG [candidate division Zixibacteria bacterium]